MDKSAIQSRGLPPLLPSLSESNPTVDSSGTESTQRQSRTRSGMNRKQSLSTDEDSVPTQGTTWPTAGKETISMSDTEALPVNNSYFLQGFRLESCKDVLSIPDPPSPAGKISSRRFSLPSSQPLRNISNASDVEDDPSSNGNVKITTRKKKRTRRSLAHVVQRSATPSMSADTASSHNPLKTPESSRQTKQLSVAEDEVEETIPAEESSTKRRKKRQSIILPSDLEPAEDGGANDDYVKTYATFKNNPSPPATPARETKTPTKPLTRNLHDLRKLVHEYTMKPKEKRNDSMPAKEILATTGYHLRSDPLRNSDQAPNELSREERINAFVKLGPDLQKMDACKVSDAKMVAQVTQCMPQKLRGGFYKYFHSESGRAVSPEEFEERYLLMLEEVDAVRSKAWIKYFDKLRGDEPTRNKFAGGIVRTPLVDEGEDDGDDDDDDAMEDEEDVDDESSAGSAACSDCGDDAESVHSDASEVEESEAREDVLPLPSRDEEPENPRIAKAQKTLFRTIDRALEVYSEEVLAAQREMASHSSPGLNAASPRGHLAEPTTK